MGQICNFWKITEMFSWLILITGSNFHMFFKKFPTVSAIWYTMATFDIKTTLRVLSLTWLAPHNFVAFFLFGQDKIIPNLEQKPKFLASIFDRENSERSYILLSWSFPFLGSKLFFMLYALFPFYSSVWLNFFLT